MNTKSKYTLYFNNVSFSIIEEFRMLLSEIDNIQYDIIDLAEFNGDANLGIFYY